MPDALRARTSKIIDRAASISDDPSKKLKPYSNRQLSYLSADSNMSLYEFDKYFRNANKLPIPIFDFDGVVAHAEEDALYRSAVGQTERAALENAAKKSGLNPDMYDTKYLRHLVFQQIHLCNEWPIREGPLLALAQELTDVKRPFFILTARSSSAAIQRVLNFTNERRLYPQEMFFVGRVAKGRQVRLVRNQVHDNVPIVYFEDSLRHRNNSLRQRVKNVWSVLVRWNFIDTSCIRNRFFLELSNLCGQSEENAA